MDCPRCDGPVEGFALVDRQAFVCGRCGWVGVDASLGEGAGDGSSESWDDAIGRVAERRVSTDRTTLPPAVAEAIRNAESPSVPPEEGGGADAHAGTDAEAGTDAGADGEPIETVEKIEEADVEVLRAAGIETVEALASADRIDLADETDIPESRVGDYIRAASIRLVASGSDGTPS